MFETIIKSRFLKYTFLFFSVVILTLFAIVVAYIRNERSFDRYVKVPSRTLAQDKQFKVGIVGDSWVAGGKLDQFVQNELSANGIDAVVISSGHPKAKSRQVYRNLFLPPEEPYSSNFILMDDEIDYLVIVAGVNDTAGHIGSDFYSYHILAIVKAALSRSIIPVIISVPEYGIEEVPGTSVCSWGKRSLFRLLYDRGKVNVIDDYRRQLHSVIEACPDKNKIVVLNFDSVATDYSVQKDLYANPSHLNAKGNEKLGGLIAHGIIKDAHFRHSFKNK